ncbi:branched-chain amino acid aminotransferase [Membranihabitans marinus]|uniref:branched-chain amino acid aminotransferase n=1 Tax=Membranihabitans marinus TaxID=1227546 RepID=UPI001F010114|nr:branched-chain amino acid aminotransferase [Membranihabitans marinus]
MKTKNYSNKGLAKDFDFDHFIFGKTPTDHMLVMEYSEGKWGAAEIAPFGPLNLSPFTLGLHYGQLVFEGIKAFRSVSGQVSIFRPRTHLERMNHSLERMCMPTIDVEVVLAGLKELVATDQKWVPLREKNDIALYIRPLVVATEARLGVKISSEYKLLIMCTPIRKYYTKPLKVKLERQFVRAAQGGVGFVKCAGNYGGAFYPTFLAQQQGFDQVIWTDASTHTYLEESGTMNIAIYFDGKLITPIGGDSVLKGVTLDSVLQLAVDHNVEVEQRPIAYTELLEYLKGRRRVEIFGVGTVAVVAPISHIEIEGIEYTSYVGGDGFMYQLESWLSDIRLGRTNDDHNWNYYVD